MAESEDRSETEVNSLVQEGDIAADYVETLLDIVDVDGDIEIGVKSERPTVAVVGERLSFLIGPRGVTLDALQDLTRMAVSAQTGARSRVLLDIGDFRSRRRGQLSRLAQRSAKRVHAIQKPISLESMNAFERKIVHDAVLECDGVVSESEGEEPHRRVVIYPAEPQWGSANDL